MSAEEVLPCWSCGGPVRLIVLRGVLSAKCRRDFTECAGAAYDTPVKLWNRRTPSAMSADHIGDAQGWRDIATAPRDGSLVLCFYPDRHDHDRYSLRYWTTGDWGVRSEGWSDQHRQLRGTEPTYWQPLPPPPSAHPAPIKPSADTGELRERVALEIRDWPFPINQHEGCLELADAILDLIQSERAG